MGPQFNRIKYVSKNYKENKIAIIYHLKNLLWEMYALLQPSMLLLYLFFKGIYYVRN